MTHLYRLSALAVGLFACQLTFAQAPAAAPATKPANATGQCKDGSYSTAASKAGACRGHNGVKEWYAAAPAKATPATPSAAAATPAAPATPSATTQVKAQSQATAQSAGQSATAPATQAAKKGPKANLANTPVAAGGGPGLVWVNTSSNVYHCYGTDFYGKTKAGSYMSEADAKAKGAHGDHGKTCSK
jgi:cytoskeletal protein RodZ